MTETAHNNGFILPGATSEEEPVFTDPWQAQAFALAVQLHQAGHFTWQEFSEMLGAQIARGSPKTDSESGQYYECWLAALEQLCTVKGITRDAELAERRQAWRQAYLDTPHGQPVSLKSQ